MSAQEPVTKRERQKQRRDVRLEEQRTQVAKARRNRLLTIGLVAVVLLAAVGAVVQGRLAASARQNEDREQAAARLTDLGCTEAAEQTNLGGGHLQTDEASLAAADPAVLYPDRPASSGQHMGQVVLTGVYDEAIDERLLVHNLEHGYVNMFYGPDAPAEQVAALKTFAQGQIDEGRNKIVVAPYDVAMPDGASFGFVSWGWRQTCGQFDQQVAEVFVTDHYNAEDAPERFLDAHLSAEASGVLDPGAQEGPLLFPPLVGAAPAPTEPAQPEASQEAPSGSDGASQDAPSPEPASSTEAAPSAEASSG